MGRGVSKVSGPSLPDRRLKKGKIGAKFPAKENFPVPEAGVTTAELDLFGGTYAPARRIAARCACCGAMFDQIAKRGRPQRYCSGECRQTIKRHQQQVLDAARKPAPPLLKCRKCGRDFQPRKRTRGRAPHWCSPACKRAHLRGAPPPGQRGTDLIDQISTQTRKDTQ